MGARIISATGVFFVPQLVLSITVFALVAGYLIARIRGELATGEKPWLRTLEPLAEVCAGIGLLGTVSGIVNGLAAGGTAALSSALGLALYTTGFGMAAALLSMIGCWLLGLQDKGKTQ